MVTYDTIRHDPEIRALVQAGGSALETLRMTDHGFSHAGMAAATAGRLLCTLGYDERTCELARIAGFMHDIGNAVNRSNHALSGALLAYQLLKERGMDVEEAVAVMTAIGNHDEGTAAPVTPLCAALILADKSDVRRSRVLAKESEFDIHDRVNYAVVDSALSVRAEEKIISLGLKIDTAICAVMDYFEIFLERMTLCRDAAAFLSMNFELVINETRML